MLMDYAISLQVHHSVKDSCDLKNSIEGDVLLEAADEKVCILNQCFKHAEPLLWVVTDRIFVSIVLAIHIFL